MWRNPRPLVVTQWERVIPWIWLALLTATHHHDLSPGLRMGQQLWNRIALDWALSPSLTWQENKLGSMCVKLNTSTGLWQLPLLSLWCVSTNNTVQTWLKIACNMFTLNCPWHIFPLCLSLDHPVILNASGCVIQAKVMTCVCVSQGVPLPVIGWLNTEEYSLTKSVLRSSVNTTVRMHVRNHTNTTVECVSINEVGRVRDKLQVTHKESQGKQGGTDISCYFVREQQLPNPTQYVCSIEDLYALSEKI